MRDYGKKARKNAKTIEYEIQTLSMGHWNLFKRKYKEFWAHARKISEMFKVLKPLRSEDRECLWKKFNSVCEEVKRKQHSEHENYKFKSKQYRSEIIQEAESARPNSFFGIDSPDNEEIMALGRILRSAGLLLSKYKKEMYGEHKQECFERIQEIRHIQDNWWEELKRYRSKRQDEFQLRVRANLEKNYERHKKATDALKRMRNHADDLRDKINSAWNDDFRNRAYEWLSETEDKIRDIEESIQMIEEWIQKDEGKLK